jgi:hypothetical protein
MIVICEKCGQTLELDPSILTSRQAQVRCKSCNYLVTVNKQGGSPESIRDVTAADLIYDSKKKGAAAGPTVSATRTGAKKGTVPKETRASSGRIAGIGLRGKLLLFFLIPLILALSVGGLFTLRQMDALGKTMTSESLRMLIRVSENEVVEYSKAIAQQLQIYLASHPDLRKEDFNNDIEFKKIAVQRISLTMRGYTSLYEPTEEGKLIFLAHVNPKYVGQDIGSLKELVGEGYDQFTRIIQVGRGGIETSGHYVQEIEGRPRDNYLVCTPVKGTPYYVSCTTYLDESTLGVVSIPMSPEFKNYLDLIIWPQDNEWWKKK